MIRGQKWSSSPLKTTDSFLGSPPFKAITPTGKRSPKGAANNCSNLSKPATASSSSTLATSMFTTTTSVVQSTSLLSSTSVLSTSLFTSYGAGNPDQQNQPSNEIASIGTGLLPTGSSYTAQSDGASIDWAKLPDPGAIEFTEPPAIEFSDSSAIEFPADFVDTWGDMLSGGV